MEMSQKQKAAAERAQQEISQDRLWWKILRAILRTIWILIDNLIGIPVYAFTMMFFYPLRLIWPRFYWEMDAFFFRELLRNVGYWMWSANYKIVEYGDLPYRYQNERCLVVINHQTTADVPTLCAAICKKGVGSGKMMWVLDIGFKFTNFGIVSRLHGDFFIQQGRDTRHLQGPLLQTHMRRCFWSRERRWAMVFPEGGFLYKRLESSQEYAKENGYPILKHVTLPRIGAVKAMLDATNPVSRSGSGSDSNSDTEGEEPLGPGFKYLVDVTLAYPNGEPLDLLQLITATRPSCEVAIYYKIIKISDVPRDNDQELTQFMYQLWEEKENLLDHFYREGEFPGAPRDEAHVVDYHLAGLLLHNGWLLALAYFYYWMIRMIISYGRYGVNSLFF